MVLIHLKTDETLVMSSLNTEMEMYDDHTVMYFFMVPNKDKPKERLLRYTIPVNMITYIENDGEDTRFPINIPAPVKDYYYEGR